jgi:ubiquinone/menaquinone biosynthesis C-methylase UbiE
MKTDYDILSKDYDLTRTINIHTVKIILSKENINTNSFILDFGCGTGNYACAIKKLTNANVFGVEPSDGMRQKAQEKTKDIEFRKGDHNSIPFNNDFFDLIYMTDVIHHIPDLKSMFTEFFRVLKPNGEIGILTESHEQIEKRFYSVYFPATVTAEKGRYPDIPDIISSANQSGFLLNENINTDNEQSFTISSEFVNLVESKGYSMFRFISDEDFSIGLKNLKDDYKNKVEIKSNHGETYLWLKKI